MFRGHNQTLTKGTITMCMQDVLIGRKSQAFQVVQTVPVTSIVLLESDSNRFSIVISPPSAGTLTLSFAETAIANEGIRIDTTGEPFILTLKEHGSLVTRRITAIMSAGSIPIGIWIARFEE